MYCRDILDGVWTHVRDIYVHHFYTTKVKTGTSNENESVDEELKMTGYDDPKSETNINIRESTGVTTETVKETIEREHDDQTLMDIRYELEQKLPYALATVCCDLAELDRMYRKKKTLDLQASFSEYLLDIGDDFPLCDRFFFPCVMFVASMALIDIDDEKSDDFYDKYATSVSQIASELPFECASTVERYPY